MIVDCILEEHSTDETATSYNITCEFQPTWHCKIRRTSQRNCSHSYTAARLLRRRLLVHDLLRWRLL